MSDQSQSSRYGELLVEAKDLSARREELARTIFRIYEPFSQVVTLMRPDTLAIADETQFPVQRGRFLELGGASLARYLDEYGDTLKQIARNRQETAQIEFDRKTAHSKPPPFVPQAIEVALGTSGDTLTLITTEAGGFTLNGEAFASGTNVAANNGSVYTLTLNGAAWSAAYIPPPALTVPLGASGSSVTVVHNEDGSFSLAETGEAITPETSVADANGEMYRFVRLDDGVLVSVAREPSS